MKILLVGDTHASRTAVSLAFDIATKSACDKIFQVGDFGFWPRFKNGNAFLQFTNDLVEDTDIPFYFLAGNHEDWNDLDIIFTTSATDEDGFHKYGKMLIAPRTHVWSWENVSFGLISGAYSIDRIRRTKDWDWFAQEVPTAEDVNDLVSRLNEAKLDHVDVMLAHDAPENIFGITGLTDWIIKSDDAEACQAICLDALTKLKPSLYMHGHWHHNIKYWRDETFCYGLDKADDGAHGAFAILDLHNDDQGKGTVSSVFLSQQDGVTTVNQTEEFAIH